MHFIDLRKRDMVKQGTKEITKKIIVADDNETSLMYIGILLKRMGFTFIPSRNGLEVLRLLKVEKADAVLLDIGMATMDGITTLKRLKEDKQTRNLPIIMVSGDSSPEIIGKCRELGCAGYLIKPVVPDKLHETIEECIFSELGTKRKHFRISYSQKVVVVREGKRYDFPAVTLSEGGIYVSGRDPFPVGSETEVELPLLKGAVSIRLAGIVVHAHGFDGDRDPAVPPGMGIRFKPMTAEVSKIVKDHLDALIAEGADYARKKH